MPELSGGRASPRKHGESNQSIMEDENSESLRGFVYPKTFRNVHRDPNSKFYVSTNDFSKDIYPEYPALSYLMILVINYYTISTISALCAILYG